MMENPMQTSKLCGAKTRSGKSCKTPGMVNGRCRMHGGKSTGRPPIHGRYTKERLNEERNWRAVLSKLLGLVDNRASN